MQNLMPPVNTPDSLFHDGNPVTGELGTIVDAQHLNNSQGAIRDIQTELIAVLASAGVPVDPSKHNQLLTALSKLLLTRSNPFGDIKSDGAVATALENLGLQFFKSSPSDLPVAFTRVQSPDLKLFFVLANNGEWGVQNGNGDTVALPPSRGGTGATNAAQAVINLGLGSGAPAIGIPFFWPSSAMPNTVMPEWANMVFLKFNGATFSAATYPKLALVWPGLKLTESRGEFVRIWDDGRGVDSGRALLSAQSDAQQAITGQFVDVTMGVNASAAGAFEMTQLTPTGLNAGTVSTFNQKNVYFDSSKVNRTAAENRPRNIAFNLLVRAK